MQKERGSLTAVDVGRPCRQVGYINCCAPIYSTSPSLSMLQNTRPCKRSCCTPKSRNKPIYQYSWSHSNSTRHHQSTSSSHQSSPQVVASKGIASLQYLETRSAWTQWKRTSGSWCKREGNERLALALSWAAGRIHMWSCTRQERQLLLQSPPGNLGPGEK